ncbi:MAG: thiamine ABC transporter substrate-binding protein [Candidatus Cloacimonetes bacterium]|nr:thiamine ABC transporter substrate-binding protein [Candidatus Cloacimonadota bacterium]
MTWLLIVLLFLQVSCSSQEDHTLNSQKSGDREIQLYACEDFRSSGFESVIVPTFEKEYRCRVLTKLFPDPSAMISAVKTNPDSVDVVVGLPSVFSASDSLGSLFSAYEPKAVEDLNRACVQNNNYRLIPYGFSYLGLLYDSSVLQEVPRSLGELQDERYLNQISLIDPAHSGSGRAMLHWVIALFGDGGFEQMLRTIRKNVHRSYSSQSEALASLKSKESTLMPGLITLAAQNKELENEAATIDFVLFNEGSFQYSECVGIIAQTNQLELAGAFVDFLLSDASQKMVAYKLGLFPANRKTLLPPSFSRVPLLPWLVTLSLNNEQIYEKTPQWLETWNRIFALY